MYDSGIISEIKNIIKENIYSRDYGNITKPLQANPEPNQQSRQDKKEGC